MSKPVMGLGVLIALLGLWVAVFPDHFISIMDWESRQGLLVAAGIRVVAGLVLLLSASSTRYPRGLRVLGAVVLVAGLGLSFLPIDLWAGLIRWALVDNGDFYRVVAGFGGVLVGAFLARAALPPQSAS